MKENKSHKVSAWEHKPTLLILQGPPASGKSTWTKEFLEESESHKKEWVVVSRDSIRESTGTYWVPEREDYISIVEVDSIKSAINNKLNVIVDATNLNPKTIQKWEDLSKELNCHIEYKQFYVPYKIALERDKNRSRSVGEKTLKQFYKKYYHKEFEQEIIRIEERYIKKQDTTLPKAIICDLDGTLCLNTEGRNPYDFSRVSEDTLNIQLYELLKIYWLSAIQIIFVSGRMGTKQCENDTRAWISKNCPDIHNWKLFMRPEKDYRSDEIIKSEIYDNFIEGNYNVLCVYDDRDRVVKYWRSQGLLCNQVYYGDF